MENIGRPHFLLVVSNPIAKEHYVQKLDTIGATYNIIEKQDELVLVQQHSGYHGIMLDVHSVLKLSGRHREIIKEYCYALPTLKFFFHPETNNTIINYSSINDLPLNNLENFVETCSKLPARPIRRDQRFNIFLNVNLNDHLTHITNISKRGCFILTTGKTLKAGGEISITIAELSDQSPIRCIINRKVEWGSKYQAAGIGVEFASLTNSQRSELDALLLDLSEKLENVQSEWDELRNYSPQHIFS